MNPNRHHESLQESRLPDVERLPGKRVSFLLGTDRHLDEGTAHQEKRVGITPEQTRVLIDWLEHVGLRPTFYVVSGAGADAGYLDTDYNQAGAAIVHENKLGSLTPRPDVVHALKEPCSYEATIPGPFMRIGALHVGAFYPSCGCATLLRKRNFAAIFDGSAIGGYTCKLSGGFQAPLRCSMSLFAGKVAADLVNHHLDGNEIVIILGGGVVGVSVLQRLLQTEVHRYSEIVLIEANADRCEHLRQLFKGQAVVQVRHSHRVDATDLKDASGLILAAFRPGDKAPKVVDLPSLQKMRNGSIIVDVSIDEGGSVLTPEGKTTEQAIAELGMNHLYVADSHMPRRYPREASEAHGRAVLPYLAVLLYLAAKTGSAAQATKHILSVDCNEAMRSYFDLLVCDLKNGLAFTGPSPVGLSERLVKGRHQVMEFLNQHGIPFEVL